MSLVAFYIKADLPCAITKNESLGTLCGYVGVPPAHPWYGKDEDALPSVDVHGGLTWHAHEQRSHLVQIAYLQRKADDFDEKSTSGLPNFYRRWLEEAKDASPEERYPCDTGQDVWWVGFDCSHLGDLTPGPDNPKPGTEHLYPLGGEGWYKDEAYVREEIDRLLSQIVAAQRGDSRYATDPNHKR